MQKRVITPAIFLSAQMLVGCTSSQETIDVNDAECHDPYTIEVDVLAAPAKGALDGTFGVRCIQATA